MNRTCNGPRKNKANLGRESQVTPAFQYSIIPPFQPDAICAEQTQFARQGQPGQGHGDVGRGPSEQTKPIRARRAPAGRSRICGHGQDARATHGRDAHATNVLRRHYERGRSCETKPIPAERKQGQVLGGERVMVDFPCIWPWQNKANSVQQSQFAAGAGGDGAWGARDVGESCETNPIWGQPGPHPGSDYAKQSQTWESWGMWARAVLVCGATLPESGMRETNPIPRRGRLPWGFSPAPCPSGLGPRRVGV
jgi:hypothetical protein